MKRKCVKCERDETEVRLDKCPICYEYFCNEHVHLRGGRRFCKRACAQYFFFGDGEDSTESGEE
jgi:hypothetical protein